MMQDVGLNQWIGHEYGLFEKLSLTLKALGYQPPTPSLENGEGAYFMNIVNEYQTDFTQDQMQDILAYARVNHKDYLARRAQEHDLMLEETRGLRT